MTLSAKWVSTDVNLPQLSLSIQNSGQLTLFCSLWASQVAQWWKYSPANAGDTGDKGLISGSGRSPGGGNGNLLQYSCLENPMDRRVWWATVHGATESEMTHQLSIHMHAHEHAHTHTIIKIVLTSQTLWNGFGHSQGLKIVFEICCFISFKN